jgi:UDP-N-acetylglucosamine 2-epimerase (non-hydrolysing)
LLFAPTELAAANLRAEQVAGEILVTGNPSIDAVLEIEARLPERRLPESAHRSILVTCHRRESWNGGLESIAEALSALATNGEFGIDVVSPPNQFVAGRLPDLLAGVDNVNLLAACSHVELVRRMRDADLVLSDSGGIQEEAPALGVPLLVLREKTERPEAVEAGTALLVGTDSGLIVSEARRLLGDPHAHAAMSRRVFPFGDGSAGRRIAAAIGQWLHERSLTRRLA